jgi:hypothetical protein
MRISPAGPLLLTLALAGCTPDAAPPDVRPSAPPIGRFASVHGTVKVRPYGEVGFRAATVGMTLQVGDVITTAADSKAEIEYLRGMKLTIRPESYSRVEAPDSTRIDGVAEFDASPQDPTVLRGGRVSLRPVADQRRSGVFEATRNGAARVRQREGAVNVVTDAGTEVVVRGNQQVAVAGTGAVAPVAVLPAAPALLSPEPHAELTYPDPESATTVLVWAAVPDAASYRVRVDAAGSFAAPLVDRTVARTTHLAIGPLPVGTYYWEVRSLGAKGEEGFPSGISGFSVKAAPAALPGPPLVVDRLDAQPAGVRIEGRTDRGARVTVNGEPIEVDENGRFREFLVMPAGGERRIVLRAVDARGRSTDVVKVVPDGGR